MNVAAIACPLASSKADASGADFYRAAADRKVAVGMKACLVRTAWGEPEDVNRTITALGTSEQWVYGIGRYVYLDDGVVTAIQD